MENEPLGQEGCPFCDIRQDSRNRVLAENELAYATLSNPRKAPGHTLIIPKRHVEKPWEIAEEELRDIFALLNAIEQRIIARIAPGCDVRQHYRPFVPQGRLKIDHVHYHLLPRSFEDRTYRIVEKDGKELFEDLTSDEQEKIEKLLS